MVRTKVTGRRQAAAFIPLGRTPDPQTWDHVVRAAAQCGQLEAAALLMRLTREHAHDPELLARTRGVRGGQLGRTLLMRAVMRPNVARAEEIVDACPTPAARAELLACVDGSGWTALHMACSPIPNRESEEAALALAELLLEAGADPRAIRRDKNGRDKQPIHAAAAWSVRLVQRLMGAGASVDGDAVGNSTLRCAAASSTAHSVRMLPVLVGLGARETGGNAAVQALARFPVKGAPALNEEVRTALTALVSAGGSLTAPDAGGWTPLDTAASRGNAPVVTALLSLAVAVTTKSLAHAVEHPSVVRLLLAAGARPGGLLRFAPGQGNVTPLMVAASASELESVRLLLGAGVGASVNRCNEDGATALMFAMRSKSTHAATVLSVVEELLDAGASVNAHDKDGDTPLHLLVICSAKQPWAVAVAQLLLDSGAVASATNQSDQTPAELVPAGAGPAGAGGLHALLLQAAEDA